MDVSITDASELADVSRTTIYNDIESGKLSVVKDGKRRRINIAELERVYGSLKTLGEKKTEASISVKREQLTSTRLADQSQLMELAVLRERMSHYEQERVREREQYKETIDNLQSSLEKAQDTQSKMTLLLEHQTKDRSGPNWEKSIHDLEERISNREKAAKDELTRARKVSQQNKALKQALSKERGKSVWQKLFG